MISPHVGKGPALLLQVLNHLFDGGQAVLMGIVLVSVGDDGHDDGVVGVAFQFLVQFGKRAPHRIIERCTGAGDVGLLRQDGGIGDRSIPVHFVDGRTVEENQGEIVLLRLLELLCGSLHASQHLVVALDGGLPDIPHGTAAVHDNHVVNLGFFNHLFHKASRLKC